MEIAELQALLNPRRSTKPPANDELRQEDFLDLMIAQLRNQDPSKPQDAGELFTQLTGFATVDGIGGLDASIQSLVANLSASQALGAASLIDRQVLVPSDQGFLEEGGTIAGSVALPFPADSVTVRIIGPSGATLRTLDLGRHPGGEVKFEWDGFDGEGIAQPPGEYGIEVEASVGGQSTALRALVSSRVESVALGGLGGETMITLAGLGQVPLSSIQEIGALQDNQEPEEQN